MQNIKIGQEVWFKATWCDVNSGIVTKFYDDNPDYVEIKGTRDTRGTQGARIINCYPTKQALLDALKSESENKIKRICERIQTVEDLVSYMYNNTVSCAEEYTDWDARKAIAIKAKELLNIELKP